MAEKDITSCRGTLEFLNQNDEILTVNREVDPLLEVAGITKACDNGPALLFKNIKGYPNTSILTGLFSRGQRLAKIFDVASPSELKLKGLHGLKNPIPPHITDSGPCQEMTITSDISVLKHIPVTQYTATDPGRILGGGIVLISGPDIGHCVSYKRTHFRGKDWASMAFNPGSHFEHWVLERRKEKRNLPLTINICPSPAVMAVAGGGVIRMAIPAGSDELGIAGGIQGSAVAICKALTVDAYSIANAEWVIEGFIDTSDVVWESEEGEKRQEFTAPFFPEAHGHLGRARTTYKFQATAITHRRDSPIFYAPIGHSFEYPNMVTFTNDAALYDLLNRQRPGLVIDVNALPSMMGLLGIVIQVKKQRSRDEDYIRNLILTAWAFSNSLRMVVVVDEDVDIYNANDVIWALITRCNAAEDLIMIPPSGGWAGAKGKSFGPTAPVWRMGFDTTVPYEHKWQYWRGEFPRVELEDWFTGAQMEKIRSLQCEYARLLAEKRV